MENDSILISRFKGKDLSAFDLLFSKYNRPIYFFIYKMVHNKEAAEDITQDTFVKVFKNLEKVEADIKLSPWIYKIAYNTFIDYTRKNRGNLELIDNLDYDNEAQDNGNQSNPESNYLNKELRNKINKTMKMLSNRYKTVLILRDYNSLSYKEVGQVLELSETAVKSLIHRARLEFQKIFKELE